MTFASLLWDLVLDW